MKELAPQLRYSAPNRRRAGPARGHARGKQFRRAGSAAGRRQDHAGAAGAARRALAERQEDHHAGAAADRGARQRRADGADARRAAGETVGYRVRFGSKISRATRIEVVTEGIFSRQILDDPELDGVAAVLFDEFHERSLDADLGLALARDAQTVLREDLRILVMSATLDGARVGSCWAMRLSCQRRPRLSGRDALSRPQGRCAASSGRWRMRSLPRCAPIPARCWCSCPAPQKSAARRIFSPSGFMMRASRSCRCSARSMPPCRTVPSRRRRRASARSCWRPRSPRLR